MLFDFIKRFWVVNPKCEFFIGGGGRSLRYEIKNSLRFRGASGGYAYRTFAASGTTAAIRMRIKRGTIGSGTQTLFGWSNGSTLSFGLDIVNDTLHLYSYSSGYVARLQTNEVLRDPAKFEDIVAVIDTTNGTAGDRLRLYVNDRRVTSFSVAAYPAQNTVLNLSLSQPWTIGRLGASGSQPFDGLISDFILVSGQAPDNTAFGRADYELGGKWVPKGYTGTYGAAGSRLLFDDGASLTTLGYDRSGNGNHWTLTGFSLTAGVSYDWFNEGTNVYATLNQISKGSSLSITNGNLRAGATTTVSVASHSTLAILSPTYWENTIDATNAVGLPVIGCGTGTALGSLTGSGQWGIGKDGWTYLNGVATNAGLSFAANDVVMCAYDPATGKFWMGKNGVWFNSGNPATGANPLATISTSNTIFASVGHYGSSAAAINFGQRPFAYTPPTGFKGLCTDNMPTPSIKNSRKHFDIGLRSGTGASATKTGLLFRPDLIWTKARSAATDHKLTDAVRGVTKALSSNSATAEVTDANGITAFTSDGYTVGPDANYNNTTGPVTYVDWLFNMGGTTVTNNAGSISAQVRANAAAGMSVVSYTGTGSNATVGHGLGVAPKLMLVFCRGSSGLNPTVYHAALTGTSNLWLNSTAAKNTQAVLWNNTDPTSTVFSVGSAGNTNSATGNVAYCFAEVPGLSKFGSYISTATADNAFVWCGFRPRWLLVKNYTAAGDWVLIDAARNTYNVMGEELLPNSSAAGVTATLVDFLDNGFKVRTGTLEPGASGSYIFAAFADYPLI